MPILKTSLDQPVSGDAWTPAPDSVKSTDSLAKPGTLSGVRRPAARRRVCLVGAGFIAAVHAEALAGLDGVEIGAVVDPDEAARTALAERWRVPRRFPSAEAAIAGGAVDCAHVLVPPALHAAVAMPFLEAGMDVLVEKPLAASAAAAAALCAAARLGGARLGVNQNFRFHPAFAALARRVADGSLGRLVHLDCVFNVPLRQLEARQFGHWMFAAPGNLLLEQAVHPLSQITRLAGPVEDLAVLPGPAREIAPGVPFHDRWQVQLAGARASAQLFFAVGQSYPCWRLAAICDDGVVAADMVANRVVVETRGKGPEFAEHWLAGRRIAAALGRQSRRNAADYVLSTLKLKRRADPFFVSMRDSIATFHGAGLHDAGAADAAAGADGAFGADLVALCERIAAAGQRPVAKPVAKPAAKSVAKPVALGAVPASAAAGFDVAVLGGTGFIGRPVVRRFLAAGCRVAVMARSVANLAAPFDDPRITLITGDVTRPADAARAIGDAAIVVNLAHGGAGPVEDALVAGARTVAEACRAAGVDRLIHVSSIAALYLGRPDAVVTGMAEVDPRAARRSAYAHGKAASERLLVDFARRSGLALCIVRPGLVVGDGGVALHGGLGFTNNGQHCLGWNAGDNPLPFVLVDDVAEAIFLASRADAAVGRRYNLVGDVRPSARGYLAELARALGRPLVFHPQSLAKQQAVELGKWLVKRAIGRPAPLPSYRDLKSRGLEARFDCTDAKRDLGWRPVADRAEFVRRGVDVYAAD